MSLENKRSIPPPAEEELELLSQIPPAPLEPFRTKYDLFQLWMTRAQNLDPKNITHRLRICLVILNLEDVPLEKRITFVESLDPKDCKRIETFLEAFIGYTMGANTKLPQDRFKELLFDFELALPAARKAGPIYDRLVETRDEFERIMQLTEHSTL